MLCTEMKMEYDSDGSSIEKTFLQKRCDFFQRYQQSHETIYTYLEVVRSLAECCNFYKTEEELLIRDRLVSGLNDREIRLKVLKTCENPTIDEILGIFKNENQQNEKYVNIGHFLASEAVEEDNTYEMSNDAVDIVIKEEPECALDGHEHDNTKEPVPTPNRADSSKGLKNLFEQHGWAHPKCSVCGKSFDNFQYLKGHLVDHAIKDKTIKTNKPLNDDGSGQLNCGLCKTKKQTHHDLVLHYATHSYRNGGILPKVKCGICGKFSAIRYLVKHMHLHIDEMPFPCTLCDKKFKSKVLLARHTRVHKAHETHFCDLCGKKFIGKVYLETHKMKVHPALDTKIHALECYLCKQQYKSVATLKTHIKRHSLPRNQLCTQCGVSFNSKHSLDRHLMRADHNGEDNKKFQCEICKSKFYDKTQYVNHRVVHTKERPYSCTYENCDKSYTTSKSLKEHKRLHTGERPYHCNFCEYECINSTYLKRHMLVHTGRDK